MPPEPSGKEVKERLKSINKTLQDLIDRVKHNDPLSATDWIDIAKILKELHETKMKLMDDHFPASYGLSFRRWYEFFAKFDAQLDEAIDGSQREDHSEDFVGAALGTILLKMKELKEKIEVDLKIE